MKPVHLALCAVAAILAGCAGLPSKPAPVVLPDRAPLGDFTHNGGAWPTSDWWRRYRDPTLDRLIDAALESAPSLATAHARFDSAREAVRLAGAASGAHVDLRGSAERQRLSDNGLFPPKLLGFQWYNQADLGLQASYTFDWWGKQRATVEAALDEAQAAEAERAAAASALASSVANAYFGWQSDENRLALAHRRLHAVERDAAIAHARVDAGLDPADAVARSDSTVAAAREAIASLEGSAKMRVVAIAALVGRSAADLPPLTVRPLPAVGASLPDDVTIDLISRRPDITASRWRVEAAQKTSESARAAFFPDISVNALAGLSSIDFGKLLEYGSRVPQASVALNLPVFDAGLLRSRYAASRASVRAAIAQYDQTVVEAARDVATQAAAREQAAAQRTQRAIQVAAARELRDSASAQVRQGITDERIALSAALALIDEQDAMIRLEADALVADIGLQRALGGGYGNPQRVAEIHSNSTKPTP